MKLTACLHKVRLDAAFALMLKGGTQFCSCSITAMRVVSKQQVHAAEVAQDNTVSAACRPQKRAVQ
jgi:hypothetical protein